MVDIRMYPNPAVSTRWRSSSVEWFRTGRITF